MLVVQTIEQVRDLLRTVRSRGDSIGFVPTMGALHEGHVSLIRMARRECDFVVVSIFVNPLQFAPSEDYQQYPRPMETDLSACRTAGVDLVFHPSADRMYGERNLTTVHVADLTERLCGRSRPTFFDGVTTVVAKLFNIVGPAAAYFGQKDAQQAIVVRRMIGDLNFPIRLRVCPIVRAENGLALSSRNQYLTAEQTDQASCLYRSLQRAQSLIQSGETDAERIIAEMCKTIESSGPVKIDYIHIVDPYTVVDVTRIDRPVLIALAVWMGRARLIDNIILDAAGDETTMGDLFDQ